MSELPINPTLSKMLFNSGEFECVQEMAIIVAMLQVRGNFYITYPPTPLPLCILKMAPKHKFTKEEPSLKVIFCYFFLHVSNFFLFEFLLF